MRPKKPLHTHRETHTKCVILCELYSLRGLIYLFGFMLVGEDTWDFIVLGLFFLSSLQQPKRWTWTCRQFRLAWHGTCLCFCSLSSSVIFYGTNPVIAATTSIVFLFSITTSNNIMETSLALTYNNVTIIVSNTGSRCIWGWCFPRGSWCSQM